MVTPEMLLFLAGKMGLPNPIISQCPNTEHRCYLRHGDGLTNVFWPHKDRIQWADVVVWAAMQGLEPDFSHGIVRAWPAGKDYPCGEENENTPDSIRAAAVVAIVRALGYEVEK